MNDTIKTLKTGTTTVCIVTKDGVVVAAEQKATMGFQVESKNAQKVHKLDDSMGLTIAGSVGDAQAVIRLMRAQIKLYKLDRVTMNVKAAANLLSNILQGSKFYPYYNLFLLVGYDSTGSHIFSIDPVGGYSSEDNFYSTGSGSPYAYGVLEAEYKEGISLNDGIELAVKAIRSAIERDIGSGGKGITVAVVTKDGFKELTSAEVKKYY